MDARGGDVADYATPFCANVDVRGTELETRDGYTKLFLTALDAPIMGIFDCITRYDQNISLPRCATVLDDDTKYNDVYSDGSYIWLADGNATRLRLTKYENGTKTEYALAGDYEGDIVMFEFGGDLRLAISDGTSARVVTFDGSALSLTDTSAATGSMYGVFVSTVMSLAYVYGNSFNFSFDGSSMAAGPSVIGSPEAIQGYTETATDIYLIQSDGVVQASSGGAWSSHATGISVDPIWSNSNISGTDYMVCVYAVGDSNYGIYTYDGTTLTRVSSRRYAFGSRDGGNFYAIDNSVFLFGNDPSDMSALASIWTPQSAYGMRMATLGGVAYVVGGKRNINGLMVVKI